MDQRYGESGHWSGRHGPALALVRFVRVEDEIGAKGEPTLRPRLASRLQRQVTAQNRRRFNGHLRISKQNRFLVKTF